jgi:transposase
MGSRRVVAEWATRRRLDEMSGLEKRSRKPLSARQVAQMLTISRDHIPAVHASSMIKIEQDVPTLLLAHDLVDQFHATIRKRKPEALDSWIAAAKESALSSFATGIASDRDAVRAALV